MIKTFLNAETGEPIVGIKTVQGGPNRNVQRDEQVAALVAELASPDIDENRLYEIIVGADHAVNRFPFGFPEYFAVLDEAVVVHADSDALHSAMAGSIWLMAQYGWALVEHTTNQAFLQYVASANFRPAAERTRLGNPFQGLCEIQRKALEYIDDPSFADELVRNSTGFARKLGLEKTTNRDVIREFLNRDIPHITAEETAIVAERFADDPEFGEPLWDLTLEFFDRVNANATAYSERISTSADRWTDYPRTLSRMVTGVCSGVSAYIRGTTDPAKALRALDVIAQADSYDFVQEVSAVRRTIGERFANYPEVAQALFDGNHFDGLQLVAAFTENSELKSRFEQIVYAEFTKDTDEGKAQVKIAEGLAARADLVDEPKLQSRLIELDRVNGRTTILISLAEHARDLGTLSQLSEHIRALNNGFSNVADERIARYNDAISDAATGEGAAQATRSTSIPPARFPTVPYAQPGRVLPAPSLAM